MTNWRKLVLFFMIFYGNGYLEAQEMHPITIAPNPIVCKWTTLGGMQYYILGHQANAADLNSAILSIKDEQATNLLKESQDSHTWGWVATGSGSALIVAGLIGASSSANINNVDPIWVATTIAGLVIDGGGVLFFSQSRTSQFAAVQRYNQVIHHDPDMSWNQNEESKPMLLSWKLKF